MRINNNFYNEKFYHYVYVTKQKIFERIGKVSKSPVILILNSFDAVNWVIKGGTD